MPAPKGHQLTAKFALEAAVPAHVIAPQTTLPPQTHGAPMQEIVGEKLPPFHGIGATPEVEGLVIEWEQANRQQPALGIADTQPEDAIDAAQMLE